METEKLLISGKGSGNKRKWFFLNIDGKYPLRERYLMMEERGKLLQ